MTTRSAPAKPFETKLGIQLCFKKKDGSEKTKHGEYLRRFVEAAQNNWELEKQAKNEASMNAARWEICDENTLLRVGTPQELTDKIKKTINEKADFMDLPYPCVVVLPYNEWNEPLNDLLQNPRTDVLLVICGREALNKDLGEKNIFPEEDVLQLSKILKQLERAYFRASAKSSEEKLSKKIDWKCRLSSYVRTDSFFVSFFTDPATAHMSRELKAALLSLKKSAALIKKGSHENPQRIPSLLMLGETGTGKTLAAQWIATQLGNRMFPLNVSTLPKNMVDVELFGANPGAYTDAPQNGKPGILEEHAGEIIFLDEIGEMELESQVRLLKYIDSGEVRRVGGCKEVKYFSSVIVAATNRPLDQWMQIENAPFRADLYYRFQYVIKIPSLKDRKEDMRLLISLLLQNPQINERDKEGNYRIEKISLEAIEYLENGTYPGNFRELEGRVQTAISRAVNERASVLCLRHLARR